MPGVEIRVGGAVDEDPGITEVSEIAVHYLLLRIRGSIGGAKRPSGSGPVKDEA